MFDEQVYFCKRSFALVIFVLSPSTVDAASSRFGTSLAILPGQVTMKHSRHHHHHRALDGASPGDILLFHHASGWNRLIPFFSGSRYHHVGLFAGGQWVIESRVTGVMKRDMSRAKVRLRFRVIPAPGGPNVGRAALEWAQTQCGSKYAFGSIIGLFFDRLFERFLGRVDIIWRQRDRVSCGELVAQAYKNAGVELFPGLDPEEVAPWDFAHLLPLRRQK